MSDSADGIEIPTAEMNTELRGDHLVVQAQTGNKSWVAILTGTHPTYTFERDFVAYQKPKTSDRAAGSVTLDGPTVIESVRYTHSGKNRTTKYHRIDPDTGEIESLEQVDVKRHFEGDD